MVITFLHVFAEVHMPAESIIPGVRCICACTFNMGRRVGSGHACIQVLTLNGVLLNGNWPEDLF